ncbi:uncharacterized protein LOC134784362, partial [Penaeus indicus]|uniref:uncharacterized protein LOC134784362 n=1 Tax=Penaeus indicus TaxID=29960 RepID=UPI00300C07AD
YYYYYYGHGSITRIYKVMALVTETLPRALKKDLYEIVALRTHIQYSDRSSLQEIRRGRYEELDREEFKVMALVTETLPRALKKDLYEIVALRTHIQYSDRDYIEKICQFLPQPRPVPVQDAPPLNAASIRLHLDRFDEMRGGHRNQSTCEVVHIHRDNERCVIDQYTASPKGAKLSTWSQMSKEDRTQMLSKYTKSLNVPMESSAETMSLNYVLLDQENDGIEDEELFEFDTSSRFFITRTSCRF